MTVDQVLENINVAKFRIREIYQEISLEVDENSTLVDLNSTSKTSDFRLWMYLMAVISYIQQQLFNERKNELQTIVDQNIAPNSQWLGSTILNFQFGDALILDTDGNPAYAKIDVSKRIVKYVSITESNGQYTAKVAKSDNESPTPLSNQELTALNSYLNKLILGNNGAATSTNADLAIIDYDIYYDALLGENNVRPNVEKAIKDYLAGLDFVGNFYLSKLEDVIQKVEGVIDFNRNDISAKKFDAANFASIDRKYSPYAGYMVIDDNNSLSDTLTFIPS